MKLNIKYTGKILLVALVVLGMGCKKFLSENDPSNLTPETYYTLPEHAEAAVAAAYAQTRFIGNGAGISALRWKYCANYASPAHNADR